MRTLEMAEMIAGAIIRDEPPQHIEPKRSKRFYLRQKWQRSVFKTSVVDGKRRCGKLTATDVAIIRRWLLTDEAKQFASPWKAATYLQRLMPFQKVSPQSIYRIIQGEGWKGVDAAWRKE